MACEEYEIERHPLSGRRPMPTLPSRDFLVRQAVLNAAAEVFPGAVALGNMAATLRAGNYEDRSEFWPRRSLLFLAVPKHFRALVESYGGTVCR